MSFLKIFCKNLFLFFIVFFFNNFQASSQVQLNKCYVGDMFSTTVLFLHFEDSTASLFYFQEAVLLSCSKESFSVQGNLLKLNNIGVFTIKRNKLKLKRRMAEWVNKKSNFKHDVKSIEEYASHLLHYSIDAKQVDEIFNCTNPIQMDE